MKQGAVNFLEKPCRAAELVDAVRQALEIAGKRHTQCRQCRDFYARLERLTPAEWQVLAATVRGLSVPDIAAETGVSKRTVQLRRSSLMQKMGASSRRILMDLVLKAGWNPETSSREEADGHSA